MTAKDLKNALLQEAVQGKLVPQIPSEGNARELLEEIRKERVSHGLDFANAKSGKKKAAKEAALAGSNPCDIPEDEIPFDIPESWEWCRLGEICNVRGGKRIPAGQKLTRENTGHKYIRVTDMKNGTVLDNDVQYITDDIYKLIKAYTISKDDVYITVAGTIGQAGTIPDFFDNANLTENADKLELYKSDKNFIVLMLNSPYIQKQIHDFITKVGQPKLAIMRIQTLVIALPPLAEQKRIVAAIEQFMPLMEEYGNKEAELTELNAKISTLTKKAILQEAVQGKLVPQISAEGNAKDSLEEIKKGKAKVAGKASSTSFASKTRAKEFPPITDDEIPFDIPESWCWCRLGEVTEIARGGSPRPIKDYLTTDEDGYNWIKIGDTDKDGKYINRTAEKIKKEGLNKTRFVHKGDFLLTNSMSFGRPYILNIDGCIHDGWLVISPKDNIFNKDFLYYVLSSTFAYNQFCDSVSGAVVKNLNSDKVRESLFPLPPLEEQKRIVAAIEKMLSLCEKLGE